MDSQFFWRAIDTIAQHKGITVSRMAIMAGLDPTCFNMSKRVLNGRERWPSTESLAKVMMVTDMSFAELSKLLEPQATDGTATAEPAKKQEPLTIDLTSLIYPSYRGRSKFTSTGEMVCGRSSYFVMITNDSMSPVYEEHDAFLMVVGMEPKLQDRVFVYPQEGAVIIGRILGMDEEFLNLQIYQEPAGPKTLKRSEIAFIHKIDWVRQ